MNLSFEALYIAVSIMDKYLINLSSMGKRAPCLVTLGTVAVMLSAKLEQKK